MSEPDLAAPEGQDPVDVAYAAHCLAHPPPQAGVPGMRHAHYMRFVDAYLLAQAQRRRVVPPEHPGGIVTPPGGVP